MKKTTKKKKTNPHGANQFVADPRQAAFLQNLLDPKSETFSNFKHSAIKAGFSEQYADHITVQMPTWLSGALRQNSMLAKAERNLDRFLDMDTNTQVMGAFGPVFSKVEKKVETGEKYKNGRKKYKKIVEKVPVYAEKPELLKIKKDVSIFIAKSVGRAVYQSTGDTGNKSNIVAVQVNVNDDREKFAA